MTPQEARKELARRELARRQSSQQAPQPNTAELAQRVKQPKASIGDKIGAFGGGALSGLTLGASDFIEAGLSSAVPIDRLVAPDGSADIRFGQFGNNLEQIRERNRKQREGAPALNTAGQIGGGVLGAGKLAQAGITATRLAPQGLKGAKGLAATTGGLAADGAALGGISSALNEGSPLNGILGGGGAAAAGNLLLRGGGSALGQLAKPITNRLNPDGAVTDALRKRLERSGQSVDDIVSKFRSSADDGNTQLTVADALGNEGQRTLAGLARTPSAERNRITEFLNQRQAGQSDRLGQGIAGGFGEETAEQATKRLTDIRRTTDNANFGAIPDQPISLAATSQAVKDALKTTNSGVKLTKAEKRIKGVRDTLFGDNGSNVSSDRVAQIRRAVSGDVNKAFRSGDTDVATNLNKIKAALTKDTDAIDGFRQANATSSQNARIIDAVGDGQAALAPSARIDDVLGQFNGLSKAEQSSFRTGLGDRFLSKIEGSAEGVNKARSFTGDKAQGLLGLADDGGKLQRNIERENLFFETRNAALGGSKTADNLADQADVSGLLGAATRGGVNLAAQIATRGAQIAQGQTPEVRKRLVDALLAKSPDSATQAIAKRIQQGQKLTEAQTRTVQLLIGGGVAAAAN